MGAEEDDGFLWTGGVGAAVDDFLFTGGVGAAAVEDFLWGAGDETDLFCSVGEVMDFL